MNPLALAALGSILRWGLGLVAGFFVSKGVWSDADAATYVTAIVTGILTLGWSLWNKYKDRIHVLTALTLPEGSTENELKAQVKAGATPPVSTAPDTIPIAKVPTSP